MRKREYWQLVYESHIAEMRYHSMSLRAEMQSPFKGVYNNVNIAQTHLECARTFRELANDDLVMIRRESMPSDVILPPLETELSTK